ncbi:hypothetical protein LguiB_006391 [Lonicera macranthoides]
MLMKNSLMSMLLLMMQKPTRYPMKFKNNLMAMLMLMMPKPTRPVPSEVKEQSNGKVSADDAESSPVPNEIQDLELSFAADDNFSGKDSKENNNEPEVESIHFC